LVPCQATMEGKDLFVLLQEMQELSALHQVQPQL
jgi:hypothetical protein